MILTDEAGNTYRVHVAPGPAGQNAVAYALPADPVPGEEVYLAANAPLMLTSTFNDEETTRLAIAPPGVTDLVVTAKRDRYTYRYVAEWKAPDGGQTSPYAYHIYRDGVYLAFVYGVTREEGLLGYGTGAPAVVGVVAAYADGTLSPRVDFPPFDPGPILPQWQLNGPVEDAWVTETINGDTKTIDVEWLEPPSNPDPGYYNPVTKYEIFNGDALVYQSSYQTKGSFSLPVDTPTQVGLVITYQQGGVSERATFPVTGPRPYEQYEFDVSNLTVGYDRLGDAYNVSVSWEKPQAVVQRDPASLDYYRVLRDGVEVWRGAYEQYSNPGFSFTAQSEEVIGTITAENVSKVQPNGERLIGTATRASITLPVIPPNTNKPPRNPYTTTEPHSTSGYTKLTVVWDKPDLVDGDPRLGSYTFYNDGYHAGTIAATAMRTHFLNVVTGLDLNKIQIVANYVQPNGYPLEPHASSPAVALAPAGTPVANNATYGTPPPPRGSTLTFDALAADEAFVPPAPWTIGEHVPSGAMSFVGTGSGGLKIGGNWPSIMYDWEDKSDFLFTVKLGAGCGSHTEVWTNTNAVNGAGSLESFTDSFVVRFHARSVYRDYDGTEKDYHNTYELAPAGMDKDTPVIPQPGDVITVERQTRSGFYGPEYHTRCELRTAAGELRKGYTVGIPDHLRNYTPAGYNGIAVVQMGEHYNVVVDEISIVNA